MAVRALRALVISCASLRPRHTVYPVHKIQWLKNDMRRAIPSGCFQLIADLAITGQ